MIRISRMEFDGSDKTIISSINPLRSIRNKDPITPEEKLKLESMVSRGIYSPYYNAHIEVDLIMPMWLALEWLCTASNMVNHYRIQDTFAESCYDLHQETDRNRLPQGQNVLISSFGNLFTFFSTLRKLAPSNWGGSPPNHFVQELEQRLQEQFPISWTILKNFQV